MSEIDPENGDIIENPNPEAEAESIEPESETAFSLNTEVQSQVDTSQSAERPECELQTDNQNSDSVFAHAQNINSLHSEEHPESDLQIEDPTIRQTFDSAHSQNVNAGSSAAEQPESEHQVDNSSGSISLHLAGTCNQDSNYGSSDSSPNGDGNEEPESDIAAFFPQNTASDNVNISEAESLSAINCNEQPGSVVSSENCRAEGERSESTESSEQTDQSDHSAEQPESYTGRDDGRTESESRYSDGSGDNMSVMECDTVVSDNSPPTELVNLPQGSDSLYGSAGHKNQPRNESTCVVDNVSELLQDECNSCDRTELASDISQNTDQILSCSASNNQQSNSQVKETFEPECDQLTREACNNSNSQVNCVSEEKYRETVDDSLDISEKVKSTLSSTTDNRQTCESENQLPNIETESSDSQNNENIPSDDTSSSQTSQPCLPIKKTSLSEPDNQHHPLADSHSVSGIQQAVRSSANDEKTQQLDDADSDFSKTDRQQQSSSLPVPRQEHIIVNSSEQHHCCNFVDKESTVERNNKEDPVVNADNVKVNDQACGMTVSSTLDSALLPTQNDDDLLCQLDAELKDTKDNSLPGESDSVEHSSDSENNIVKVERNSHDRVEDLMKETEDSMKNLTEKEREIIRLKADIENTQEELLSTQKQSKSLKKELDRLKERNADDLYLPQIKELEYTIAQQQKDITTLKEKLLSHDSAAKKTILNIQAEMKTRIDQVSKLYEECVKEKDSMVMKFAQSEQRYLESLRQIEKQDAKMKDLLKEKENMINKMKGLKTEKQKLALDLNNKTLELNNIFKELEKRREAGNSADLRIKWCENKIKAEVEAHKETKAALEKMNLKFKDKQQEADQLRRDCQKMIQQYQESEEFKSNSLDIELRKKNSELQLQMQEKSDQEELHIMTKKELDSLKVKHKDTFEELNTAKDKITCLEEERQQNEQTIIKFKEIMQKQKHENKDLQDKVDKLTLVQDDFHRAQGMIKALDKDITELKVSNKDLLQDMEACRRRESEVLHLTETLSKKNAQLQSENTLSNNKISSLSSELEHCKMELHLFDSNSKSLETKLKEELKETTSQLETLKVKFAEKSTKVDQLTRLIEDEKDENKTLKRRHASNIKDLTRQLQQLRKKLECFENHGENGKDSTSLGSRTSSSNSLNTIETTTNHQPPGSTSSGSTQSSRAPSQEQDFPVITEQIEVDKQVLIERIVKLQRGLARKNEKIDFTEDQNHQLLHEIQRKNKLIQSYVMREESGQLSPDYMDLNKSAARKETQALLSKKGGIMASVYTSHAVDGHMNLDLSLEINKKLQAVLEDTLLKNITLKESLDTLGQEISRLSQENRRLQLQLQQR